MAFALVACGGGSNVGDKEINKFLTDLSQAYVSDFKGPNPDDMVKIDFAVRRLAIDSPDAFTMKGKDMVIDAEKVRAMAEKYFAYPITKDTYTNEVDYEGGQYAFRKGDDQEFVFSQVDQILGTRGDTVMVNANIYSCKQGWKGDINSAPDSWKSADPGNVPQKYKSMRAVLVKKADGYRVISYTPTVN